MLRTIYVAIALLVMAATATTGVNDDLPRRDLGALRLRNTLEIPATFQVGQVDLFGGVDLFDAEYVGELTLEPGRRGWFRDDTGARRIVRRDRDWVVLAVLPIGEDLVEHYCTLDRRIRTDGLPARQRAFRGTPRDRFALCFE